MSFCNKHLKHLQVEMNEQRGSRRDLLGHKSFPFYFSHFIIFLFFFSFEFCFIPGRGSLQGRRADAKGWGMIGIEIHDLKYTLNK